MVAANPKTPRAITSATMGEDKKNLKERLGAIMKNRKPTRYAIVMSALLIVLAAGLTVALGSCGGNENDPIVIESQSPNGYPPAYNEEPEPYDPITEEPPSIELTLQMAPASDALLDTFDSYHEIDFREYYIAHWGADLDWLSINAPAAIWANAPLYNFQIIGLYNNFVDDGVTAHATHVYYEIAVLDAPLVINWFFTAGLFPNNGISFVDASGVRRYFVIQAGYGYEGSAPFTLIEFTTDGYIFRWDAPEDTPDIISGDFEITIPLIAQDEIILLGILDLEPGDTYRLVVNAEEGRVFAGVTNNPNATGAGAGAGAGVGTWRPLVSGGSSVIVTHYGHEYRYLFIGSLGSDVPLVNAHISIRFNHN